jgi:hypothetical protein
MSVNIYPANIERQVIEHVDDFDDDSTLNVTNHNFHDLASALGLSQFMLVPGTMKVKTLEIALQTAPHTSYTPKLRQICAIARIKKADCIAFT